MKLETCHILAVSDLHTSTCMHFTTLSSTSQVDKNVGMNVSS